MSQRFPGRRFSFFRLFIVVLVLAVVAVGGAVGWSFLQVNKSTADRWFGGYVDVTATPAFEFESLTAPQYQNIVLSFLVSDQGQCSVSWGGFYSPQAAAETLDLDRRVARVTRAGYEVVLSFGGALNESVESACDSSSDLAAIYRQVLDRYGSDVLDLDIEGDDLVDVESRNRRVAAVKEVQDERVGAGDSLGVWLTLPADRSGLTGDGIAVVKEFLAAGVTVSGVNLMVMNFGVPSREETQATLSQEAMNSAHAQLRNLYWLEGEFYSDAQLWRRLGATPMIGQNDNSDETFTLQDASALQMFASEVGLGRLSFWSLNRDEQCGANYPNQTVVATFCSGVDQDQGQFAEILADGLSGGAAAAAEQVHSDVPAQSQVLEDDPETSPYPIWEANAAYSEGTKVVWHGNVYSALWWTRGDQPDYPTAAGGAPWRLVGPVLADDRPVVEPTLPEDFFPAWKASEVYHRGDRVMHEGTPYEAKWWTQGDSPDAGTADPGSSPWEKLSAEEISLLLKAGPE